MLSALQLFTTFFGAVNFQRCISTFLLLATRALNEFWLTALFPLEFSSNR